MKVPAVVAPLAGLLLLLGIAPGSTLAADWRETAGDAEKLSNLVKLIPNTAIWMQQMGHRYGDLYFAAKQEKWDFAAYQAEEMEKLVRYVEVARPKRAATAQEFRAAVFPMLHEEIAKQDWAAFEKAFDTLSAECMSCHVKNDHGFVGLPNPPLRPHSPVLDAGS